jgi:PPOX class probable F420-dependent enzyme
MTDLDQFAHLAAAEQGLCVVVTLRADGTPQSTVVNAGVMAHPLSGEPRVAFVCAGGTRKQANLRADPTVALTARAGWRWITVEGRAELVGPDDPHPEVDAERLRVLLREVFTAAGGTHDDWDAYDRAMRDERREAVLVTPTRVYSNRR